MSLVAVLVITCQNSFTRRPAQIRGLNDKKWLLILNNSIIFLTDLLLLRNIINDNSFVVIYILPFSLMLAQKSHTVALNKTEQQGSKNLSYISLCCLIQNVLTAHANFLSRRFKDLRTSVVTKQVDLWDSPSNRNQFGEFGSFQRLRLGVLGSQLSLYNQPVSCS